MTDIGFGLINRRTVIVVLFIMVMSVTVMNNRLPINIANAGDFFVDLVLFTGYLIFARSLYRLPFAMGYSIIEGVPSSYATMSEWIKKSDKESSSKTVNFLVSVGVRLARAVLASLLFLVFIPVFLFSFGRWIENTRRLLYDPDDHTTWHKTNVSLMSDKEYFVKLCVRFLDRVGLILLTYWSTLPSSSSTVKVLGQFGLLLVVVIYLFRGDFSFIVKDSVGEKDKALFRHDETG